jgi:hypothetical protein
MKIVAIRCWWLILTSWVALGLAAPALAQDEVIISDPKTKKETRLLGTIQTESPGQITVRLAAGGRPRTLPVAEVLDVVYDVPILIKQEYRAAVNAEGRAEKGIRHEDRRKELALALRRYQDLQAKITEVKAKRHLEFKIAKLLALKAVDDPAEAAAAGERLVQFRKDYPQAWQTVAAAELLAHLQMEKNDWEAARKTYEDLAGTPNLSEEERLGAELQAAQVLVRARRFSEAQKKIESLEKSVPADSPQAVRLQLSLAECQAAAGKADPAAQKVEALLDKLTDPGLKGLAYNALGDCHRLAKKPKEALWDYLWVDVVYNQDRTEHAKALYYLSQLFKELRDEPRSKQYRERLEKDQRFAGTEYQKQITVEK